MEYNEIKQKYEEATRKWNEFKDGIDQTWDYSRPYHEYEMKVYRSDIYREYCRWSEMELANRPIYTLRNPEKWEKDLGIPLNSFLSDCRNNRFTDDDGVGYYGTEDKISDICVSPCEFLHCPRKDFTHVWWYNK